MPNDDKRIDLDAQPVEPLGTRELWDRLDGETEKGFDAFTRYRDLAEKRSFKSIAEQLNCSTQNVWQWATKYRWKERALAYDIRKDEEHRIEMAKGRAAMRERQAKCGVIMQSVSMRALAEWQARIDQGLPLDLSVAEITQLMEVGSKLERLARGEERDSKYSVIQVILGDHEYEGEKDEHLVLLEGEPKKVIN